MNHHHKGKNRRLVKYAAILAAAVLTGALSVTCAFAAIAPAGSDGDAGKIWIGENREQTYETLQPRERATLSTFRGISGRMEPRRRERRSTKPSRLMLQKTP